VIREISNNLHDEKDATKLREQLIEQHEKKKSRKQKTAVSKSSCGNQVAEGDHDKDDDKKVFGTIKINDSNNNGKEVNIGFRHDSSSSSSNQTLLSYPGGGLEGKSIIQFDTDAPPKIVASIRSMGCGPLLALIGSSIDGPFSSSLVHDKDYDFVLDENNKSNYDCHGYRHASRERIIHSKDTLEQSVLAVSSFIGEKDTTSTNTYTEYVHEYKTKFQSALDLWGRHAIDVWMESVDVQRYIMQQQQQQQQDGGSKSAEKDIIGSSSVTISNSQSLSLAQLAQEVQMKIQGKLPMKFRVSCLDQLQKKETIYTSERNSFQGLRIY